jgi:DNA-binding transcriptional MerR regulator
MRTLKTREAASLLNVSPNTLRTWERKFGYPRPVRSPGRHRAYTYGEIVALRDALRRGLSVPSAVSVVREGLGADTEALVDSLDAFNLEGADRAMEASLGLRSMERSVDEMLLPALDEVRRRDGATSTKWAVAHRWGIEWLGRAQRLSPPAPHGSGVLIGDASGQLGTAGPSIRALELFCRRGGLEVLVLPVVALAGLPDAVAVMSPLCLVVAGSQSTDEQIGRWTYAVHHVAGALPTALFLRPPRSPRPDGAARVLSPVPIEAHQELVALVGRAKRAASGGQANPLAQPG